MAEARRGDAMKRFAKPICVAISTLMVASADAVDTGRYWELTPYQIDIVVAVDLDGVNAEKFAEAALLRVRRRIETAIGPLWSANVTRADGANRRTVLRSLAAGVPMAPAGLRDDSDKWIIVAVEERGASIRISAVEQDRLLNAWGQTRTVELSTADHLGEAIFDLVCDVFAPIATFSLDSDDYNRALLSLRGGKLPSPTDRSRWVAPDDVFRTVLIRMDRAGVPVEGGTTEVMWTYLVVRPPGDAQGDEATGDDPADVTADVFSHTRRPFGVRRRGRVDQLAIRLPRTQGPSELRLVSRGENPRPLVGYEVFAQDGINDEKPSIGKTGLDGAIVVPPGDSRIQTVWVKSGTQLAAKIPIATGADPLIVAPLLDESKRLDAEARLGLLREQLIDLVAERSILAARIEKAIEARDFKSARTLIADFRKLAGRAEFNIQIDREEEQSKADDPLVQGRIDKLFADMKSVLGAFLGGDDINRLERSLDAAQSSAADDDAAGATAATR